MTMFWKAVHKHLNQNENSGFPKFCFWNATVIIYNVDRPLLVCVLLELLLLADKVQLFSDFWPRNCVQNVQTILLKLYHVYYIFCKLEKITDCVQKGKLVYSNCTQYVNSIRCIFFVHIYRKYIHLCYTYFVHTNNDQ